MLSAIAVRKAVQAANKDTTASKKEGDKSLSDSSSVHAETRPAVSKPSSKRKSATHPNRKRKERRIEPKDVRYFAENDQFEKQEDIIAIDSDEESVSDDPPPPSTSKRRWSPSVPAKNSSDEEASGNDSSDMDGSPQPTPTLEASEVISTFCPIPEQNTFMLTSDEVQALGSPSSTEDQAALVVLRDKETICLLGTYCFSVLKGSVSFSGVTLSASQRMYRVFSPRSSPLPILEGISSDIIASGLKSKLPSRLYPLTQAPAALILVHELVTGVEGLGNVCRTFDGTFKPPSWGENVSSLLQLSGLHVVTKQTRDIQSFSLPPSWGLALPHNPFSGSSSSPVGIHLVKGPKKSGKSTFARTLVNALLNQYQKVAFLECDLGQSEFTPGGMVALNVIESSIFGPPFTHPTLPNFAHYIGGTTPRSSPSHYIAAIQALLESYRLDVQVLSDPMEADDDDTRISDFIPLVVNTMGWNKGLGADLTYKIEDLVQPTDIYEIEAPASFDRGWMTPAPLPSYPPRNHAATVHVLQPIPPSILSTNFSPADHRSLSLLSYFHAVFPTTQNNNSLSQITATKWNTTLPLYARPPYEVEPSRAFEAIVLVGTGMEDVVQEEIGRVLNGAIVGLVSCEPGTLDHDVNMSAVIPYTQSSPPPSPSTSKCHGLALIRSISSITLQPSPVHMHILTPVPPHSLARSTVLVKGEIELPIWGMLGLADDSGEFGDVAGVEKLKVPYLQWSKGEGIGGERRRIRRNLMRRGQV